MQAHRPHKDLLVWQKSMDLVVKIYKETSEFPKSEEFGLKQQLRRSSVSVPSNIAEGLARSSQKERLHFLSYTQGSLSELDTQIEISRRLEFMDDKVSTDLSDRVVEVQKLLSGLIRSIR